MRDIQNLWRTGVEIGYCESVDQFWSRHRDFLLKNEQTCGFLIANLLTHMEEKVPMERFYLASVGDENKRVLATWLPKQNLVLSGSSGVADAAATFAEDFHRLGVPVPAVWGPVELVEAFSERWCALRDKRVVLVDPQLLHQLDSLNPVRPAQGEMRIAGEADMPLIREWTAAFMKETGFDGQANHFDPVAKRCLAKSNAFLWEHGEAVCMAFVTRESVHGGFVGYVYTPTDQRGHGYASCLVEAICKTKLAAGSTRMWLFTDPRNKTSNAIYRRIGFEPTLHYKMDLYGD